MSHYRWALAALLLGNAGCSAPAACEEGIDSLAGLGAESEQIEGSLRAAGANEGKEWRLRATLRGLPELWQGDSAILRGTLAVAVSVAYESEPVGGDGFTEMPTLRLNFGGLTPDPWTSYETPKFAGPAASQFAAPVFDTCFVSGQKNCCPYGARECSLPITLRVERVEGAPFPPIAVDWSARSSVRVSTCPRGGGAPTLSLEVEGE